MDIEQKNRELLKEQGDFIRKSLAPTFDDIKDEIIKGKRAQMGEVREWGGVKMRKEANGWIPVKEDVEKPKAEGEGGGEQKPQDIGEAAKSASEGALQNAIKLSNDPKVREAAHRELERRKKEEATDTFKAPEEKKGSVDWDSREESERKDSESRKKRWEEEDKQREKETKKEDGIKIDSDLVDKFKKLSPEAQKRVLDDMTKEKPKNDLSEEVNKMLEGMSSEQRKKVLERAIKIGEDMNKERIEGKNGFTDKSGEWHDTDNPRGDVRYQEKMKEEGRKNYEKEYAQPGSQAAEEQKKERNKKGESDDMGVSQDTHDNLMMAIGNIDANLRKMEKVNGDSVKKIWDNLDSDKPDYKKAISLLRDVSANYDGKVFVKGYLDKIADKLEEEMAYKSKNGKSEIKKSLLLQNIEDQDLIEKSHINEFVYNEDMKVSKTGKELKEKFQEQIKGEVEEIREYMENVNGLLVSIGEQPTKQVKDVWYYKIDGWEDKLPVLPMIYGAGYKSLEGESNSEDRDVNKYKYDQLVSKLIDCYIEVLMLNTMINSMKDSKEYKLTVRQAAMLGF